MYTLKYKLKNGVKKEFSNVDFKLVRVYLDSVKESHPDLAYTLTNAGGVVLDEG